MENRNATLNSGARQGKVCTFFGHRDTPASVEALLRPQLAELMEEAQVSWFLVGDEGAFDAMAQRVLAEYESSLGRRLYEVVLAFLPAGRPPRRADVPTVFPDGLETVPRRFAIDRRKRWMLHKSDVVVTYVRGPAGGAAKFRALALKAGKQVVDLAAREKEESASPRFAAKFVKTAKLGLVKQDKIIYNDKE